jgi:ADP-ribose pyrophosphatase YjhB (NUDIX family)
MASMARNHVGSWLGLLLKAISHGRRAWWFIRRPVTLGVRSLVLDGDRLLLVRPHGQGRWHLPGGSVNRNETLVEGALRETREETGCEVEIERLLGMYFTNWSWKSDHVAVFVARGRSPIAVRPNIEIAEARYFAITALPAGAEPTVHRRLREYLNGAVGIYGHW